MMAKANDPRTPVRLPQQLKKKIERHARLNGRSVNSEIIQRLHDSFEMDRRRIAAS